jgi:hypothetical protein
MGHFAQPLYGIQTRGGLIPGRITPTHGVDCLIVFIGRINRLFNAIA